MQNWKNRISFRQIRESEPLDFSSDLRALIAEVRKCQTLYANCEGSYERRHFDATREEESLKHYVFNTLYSDIHNHLTVEPDKKKIKHVESICAAILSMSKRYCSNGVECAVVWVYACEPRTNSFQCLPVFKIYKKKFKNDAILLDDQLVEYESWNKYLNEAKFPESLLCFPRHGQYNFDTDEQKLDLEFLTANFRVSVGARTFSRCRQKFLPFCVNVIRPKINEIKTWKEKIVKRVNIIFEIFLDFLKHYRCDILIVIVMVFAFYIAPSCVTISNLGVMLLNSTQKETKPLESDSSKKLISQNFNYLGELLKLLSDKDKGWEEKLKTFCDLPENSELTLRSICNSPKVFRMCQMIVDFIRPLLSNLPNSSILNPSKDEKKIVSKVENLFEMLEISKVQKLDDSSTANFWSLLNLESCSENHETKMVASLASCGFTVEESLESSRFVFTNKISAPMMFNIIRREFGENCTMRSTENNIVDVMTADANQVLGTVFFRTDCELYIIRRKEAVLVPVQ